MSTTGRHRFYAADRSDRPAFTTALLAAVPAAADLLALAPPGGRRMVDTDGVRVDVYLDDLHLHGDPRMCDVLDHPSGARSHLVFADGPPPAWAALAGEGRFVRRLGDRTSWLWVTEARWRGRVDVVAALAAAHLPSPPAWRALLAEVPGAYLDGAELHPDGTIDLTLGVLP